MMEAEILKHGKIGIFDNLSSSFVGAVLLYEKCHFDLKQTTHSFLTVCRCGQHPHRQRYQEVGGASLKPRSLYR